MAPRNSRPGCDYSAVENADMDKKTTTVEALHIYGQQVGGCYRHNCSTLQHFVARILVENTEQTDR